MQNEEIMIEGENAIEQIFTTWDKWFKKINSLPFKKVGNTLIKNIALN